MVLAGEVESAGAEVTAFRRGDQVFGLDRRVFGTYAEYVRWPQDTVLAAMPGGLTHERAAAIPYGGLLAQRGHSALTARRLRHNDEISRCVPFAPGQLAAPW
jgi:NADPH:quinone reductase-like Zn-dependent oxidoreductase